MKKLIILLLVLVCYTLFAQVPSTISRDNFNGVNVYSGTFTNIDSAVTATYSEFEDWTDVFGQTLEIHYKLTTTSGTATHDTISVIIEGTNKKDNANRVILEYCDTVSNIVSGTSGYTALSLSGHPPNFRIRLAPKGANKNNKNAQFDWYIVPTVMPTNTIPLWFKSN